MECLNEVQKQRLETLVEKLHTNNGSTSYTGIARGTGLSGRVIYMYFGERGKIPVGNALLICRYLGINPEYVLDGSGSKFRNWGEVFREGNVYYHSTSPSQLELSD